MTIKELFKKVNTYNELASIMGKNPAYVWVDLGLIEQHKFSSFKELKQAITNEYVEPIAKQIIENDFTVDVYNIVKADYYAIKLSETYCISVSE